MKTTLIPIGNSRGVRIPKALIEQCGLGNDIELDVRDRSIIIRSPRDIREGWSEAFAQMAAQGDDRMRDAPLPTRWDKEEWEWS